MNNKSTKLLVSISPCAERSGHIGLETQNKDSGYIRTPKMKIGKASGTEAMIEHHFQSPRQVPSIPPAEVGRRYDRWK